MELSTGLQQYDSITLSNLGSKHFIVRYNMWNTQVTLGFDLSSSSESPKAVMFSKCRSHTKLQRTFIGDICHLSGQTEMKLTDL